jgi:hypothetical protein
VPKTNKYFTKKDFYWNGTDDAPIDVFHSEEQITCSMAGSAVSGDGKLHGYITIDSSAQNAFNDEVCMELRELAALTEEVLRILDLNFRLDNENNLFYGMFKDVSDLFCCVSKGNLINKLSEILQYNFRFDRLMIITPEEGEKWLISEALGEQKEIFKGVSFYFHEHCLLHELLFGRNNIIHKTKLSIDPYQCRLYEGEPKNLELRSVFAVTAPALNNSYPLIIMLENRNNRAVSKIDETLLNSIAACAALKLSDMQAKDDSRQKKEDDLAGIDSIGLGALLNYYETDIEIFRESEEGIGILFLKCLPAKKEDIALNFERFLKILKNFKKALNVRHLAMIGSDEFVLSMKVSFNEDTFDITAKSLITNLESMLAEYYITIKHYPMWLNKTKIRELEAQYGQNARTLFAIQLMKEFKAMSGTDA